MGKLLTNCKDKDKSKKNGVYQINCKYCDALYIRQTGRNLNKKLVHILEAGKTLSPNSYLLSIF